MKISLVVALVLGSSSAMANPDNIYVSESDKIDKLFVSKYIGRAKDCVHGLLDGVGFKLKVAQGKSLKAIVIKSLNESNGHGTFYSFGAMLAENGGLLELVNGPECCLTSVEIQALESFKD